MPESRNDLLQWLNNFFQVNVSSIQNLGTGAMYVQILDSIYPDECDLEKVDWMAESETDSLKNLKVMQGVVLRLRIPMPKTDYQAVAKGQIMANLDLLRFMKKFWDANYRADADYDAASKRQELLKLRRRKSSDQQADRRKSFNSTRKSTGTRKSTESSRNMGSQRLGSRGANSNTAQFGGMRRQQSRDELFVTNDSGGGAAEIRSDQGGSGGQRSGSDGQPAVKPDSGLERVAEGYRSVFDAISGGKSHLTSVNIEMLGFKPDMAEQMVATHSVQGDGMLDFDGFVALMSDPSTNLGDAGGGSSGVGGEGQGQGNDSADDGGGAGARESSNGEIQTPRSHNERSATEPGDDAQPGPDAPEGQNVAWLQARLEDEINISTQLEGERDFYYNKLREVEVILVNAQAHTSDTQTVENVLQVLWKPR